MRCAPVMVAVVLAFVLSGAGLAAAERATSKGILPYAGNRIAVDADGNFNDPDDWAATPATLAILARQELQGKLVHYSYNNSLGANGNDAFMYAEMTRSTLLAAERFGFDQSRFYDLQTQLADGIASLRAQIEISSATDQLYVIAAGPMEFLWRTIAGTDPAKRDFVTIISHSPWNNDRVWPPAMTHTADDVKALGVHWVQISDQNVGFNSRGDWSPWYWTRDAGQLRIRRIYDRMQAEGKPDISDAGMAYYLLTGDQTGTAAKLRTYLADWAAPAGAPATVVAQAERASIYRGRVDSDHPGSTGDGFVNFANERGSYVRFSVASPRFARATLSFRYANGSGINRPLEVKVNGRVLRSALAFGPTGDWSTWQIKTVPADLSAGTNTIRVRSVGATGGPNLDRLVVSVN